MTSQEYKALAESGADADFYTLSDRIDQMPYAERIELREVLEAEGYRKLVRNLYFDYSKQVWIEKAGAQ